jgi:glyoxylase-like metal-dependent hydrolase (beta-lactamase superfamily II)
VTLPYPHIREGVKAYFIDSDKQTLIDTGGPSEDSLSALRKRLNKLGTDVKNIEMILNTHTHPDHFGGDHYVKQESGADVLVHPLEAPVLRNPSSMLNKWKNAYSEAGLHWTPSRYKYLVGTLKGVNPDGSLSDGDQIDLVSVSLRVIHTPGHSPGHVCFHHEESGVLFSGDHVLGAGSVYVGGPDGDLSRYLESLKELLKLQIDLILSAHGPPVEDPHGRIRQILRHQEWREEQILEILSGKPKDLQAVTEAVYSTERAVPVLGRMATLERLKKLMDDGRVVRADDRDRTVYLLK